MESPQSVVSPFKNSPVTEPKNPKSNPFTHSSGPTSNGKQAPAAATIHNPEDFIGVLEVYIHQARDVHNICIYHKQDVYAKLCFTDNSENSVSTKIINGGGRNPVFNENLQLDVQTIETSLKCEIWMLSRVQNYLQDQLLGFALVPLSEVVVTTGGKLEKEFSLSSTDLFHSPAGFVQLSLSYHGASPDVMTIPKISLDSEKIMESLPSSDLDKIEFPDPKIANEDQIMVSEYFGMSCSSLASESSESLCSSDIGSHGTESVQLPKLDSPPSSVSTNGVSSEFLTKEEDVSVEKPKSPEEGKEGESDSSNGAPNNVSKPLVSVNIEPEQQMVQQDIVDMYMKSMQQFTESLAKMKLPLDVDGSGPTSSGDSSSDQGSKSSGPRVFYGSRAFF